MADGSVEGSMSDSGSEFMIVLDHEGWVAFFPYFSGDARVVTIYSQVQEIPMEVDLSVNSFSWPQPVLAVTVGVTEPDLNAFRSRLLAAGIELPAFEPGTFMNIDPSSVDPDDLAPGSSIEMDCPSCGTTELYVVGSRLLHELTREYARQRKKHWEWRPCSDHGGHVFIARKKHYALQCPGCMDTFVMNSDGITRFRQEVS